MTTFTVFATATTDQPAAVVEAAVRAALDAIGANLIPCNWAPDRDTIEEQSGLDFGTLELIDLN